MSSVIAITAFAPAHIAEALALWRTSPGVGLSDADEPDALAAYLARNPGLSLVALSEGRIIGTILCGHDGRRGLIHHLMVAASHQRRGIARRLLAQGLHGLRAAGIAKCHLHVYRTNEAGLAFWRSVGAEPRTTLALLSIATDAPLR